MDSGKPAGVSLYFHKISPQRVSDSGVAWGRLGVKCVGGGGALPQTRPCSNGTPSRVLSSSGNGESRTSTSKLGTC